jgi:hypothetical protein
VYRCVDRTVRCRVQLRPCVGARCVNLRGTALHVGVLSVSCLVSDWLPTLPSRLSISPAHLPMHPAHVRLNFDFALLRSRARLPPKTKKGGASKGLEERSALSRHLSAGGGHGGGYVSFFRCFRSVQIGWVMILIRRGGSVWLIYTLLQTMTELLDGVCGVFLGRKDGFDTRFFVL